MTQQTAKHIIFAGKVQGVGFRFTAMNSAIRFQLTGFVRNLHDGTVEMVAQGFPDDIDSCIRDLRDYYDTNISDIRQQQRPYDPKYNDFRITF